MSSFWLFWEGACMYLTKKSEIYPHICLYHPIGADWGMYLSVLGLSVVNG